MRFLLSLASSVAQFAAFLGKWLFIVTAPVLLIVTVSYYHAGKSCLEPLFGLGLVSGMFALTNWLSLKMGGLQPNSLGTDLQEVEVKVGQPSGEAELWNLQLEGESCGQVREKVATRRNGQCQAEMWRQANPWGGYNPFE